MAPYDNGLGYSGGNVSDDIDIDDYSEAYVAWFQGLPDGSVVEWTTHHMSAEHPWASSWVDIDVPALQADVPCGWVFTVITPDEYDQDHNEDSPSPKWNFPWEPDMTVGFVWDPGFFRKQADGTYWYADDEGPERAAVAWPVGTLPPDDAVAVLQAALDAGTPDAAVHGKAAWSAGAVTAALDWWVAEHAARPDIRFRWEPDGPVPEALVRARETMERVRAGEEELYLLKPGDADGGDGLTVMASEQVMDFLLEQEFGDGA